VNDYTLTADKLAELRVTHRTTRDKREADRIKAVVLLATGWGAEAVAEVLQVDANTVRNHFECYRNGGLETLVHVAYRGSECTLQGFKDCGDSVRISAVPKDRSEIIPRSLRPLRGKAPRGQ